MSDMADDAPSRAPDAELTPAGGHPVPAADALVALSILGQDLRSALVGTAGAAELGIATADDTRTRVQLDELLRGLNGAIALVDDLMSFTVAVADEDPTIFTPTELLGECLAQASNQVQRSAVVVRSVLGAGKGLAVRGDRAACELLITTLLRSAIIHATSHEVVAAVEAAVDGDRVTLRFRIGIDRMDAPVAADRLLSLCRSIAVRLDGRLRSLDAGGFLLELELESASHDGVDHEPATAELMVGRSALVVDDDPALRQVYATLLSDLGADCHEAADGIQAVERCVKRPFDLVLMDLNMPRMDGFAAIRAIRELNGEHPAPPIVAITALGDPDAGSRSVAEGAVTCLRKPLRRPQVVAAIRRCFAPVSTTDDDADASFVDGQLRETLDLMGGGEQAMATLRNLVDSYHAVTPGTVAELRTAADAAPLDVAVIERLAHTLKSRSAALGLAGARDAAAVLEDRARCGELVSEEAADLIERFERARASGVERLALFLELEVET